MKRIAALLLALLLLCPLIATLSLPVLAADASECEGEHRGLYECSDTCKECGTTITAQKSHEGAIPCLSTVCKYGCGTAITPAQHQVNRACDAVCKICLSPVDHEEHIGETPCLSTVCKYGCGTVVTPLPHNFGSWQKCAATHHQKLCDCGTIQYGDHTFGEGTVTKEATESVAGEKVYTCADCGEVKTETLAKLPAKDTVTADQNGNSENTTGKQKGLSPVAIVAIAIGSAAIVSIGSFATYKICFYKIKKGAKKR